MGAFYRISRIHDILVIVFTNQFTLFKIFDILALTFGFGNQNNTPISQIIFYFDNAAIRFYAGIFNKKCLSQFTINIPKSIIYFFFGNTFPIPER